MLRLTTESICSTNVFYGRQIHFLWKQHIPMDNVTLNTTHCELSNGVHSCIIPAVLSAAHSVLPSPALLVSTPLLENKNQSASSSTTRSLWIVTVPNKILQQSLVTNRTSLTGLQQTAVQLQGLFLHSTAGCRGHGRLQEHPLAKQVDLELCKKNIRVKNRN